VRPFGNDEPLPDGGLLIVSPVALVGVYEPTDRFQRLWAVEPIAVIGHAMLVYDLDELRSK
jgi:hypothetical protein